METNQVNTELEMLREQLAEFKGRLDKQEIINERLIRQAMKSHVSWIKNMNYWMSIAGCIVLPIFIIFFSKLHVSWFCNAFLALLIIGEIIFNFYNVHTINDKLMSEEDIITVRQKLLAYKKREKWQIIIETPLSIIWVILFLYDINAFHSTIGPAIGCIMGVLIGMGIMSIIYFREMRSLNRAIHISNDFSNE
ncbi:MAG: hypothetical protein J6W77_07675 [Prevotella sp.]|nr:hypothetical protein [Prevotella sp.]